MPEEIRKREIAHKVTIEILNKFPYKEQSGWLPNYIEYKNKKISRVNLIATIILKSEQENEQQKVMFIDDGTDQIEARTFENDFNFERYNIGDVINVIGRIRLFNNKKYIVPEIIKKIKNMKLLELRNKELELERIRLSKIKEVKKVYEENIKIEGNLPIYNKIIDEIKKQDKGDGVSIQQILIDTNLINRDELITELLEKGDIFEISPGRVKILE